MSALRTLVLSSRPLSWVNTAFPFGLTYYLFVGEFDAVFVVGSLFFLIPYNVLMYGINDVFDYESDLRNPAYCLRYGKSPPCCEGIHS